ncbi:MAG: polyisoprenoid-binding protein [Rhodanobacteraceae bacterium]|nr:MAG: polyisoprenoid-binding protein [Rhodanobacteraceae bacterium]
MRKPCWGLLLLLAAAPAWAQAWQVDYAHSTLAFTNAYQTVEYTGQFRRFTAAIDYDPADLAQAKFDVTVDIASLDTHMAERDHAALGADFLDAAKFPKARFVTTAFHESANGEVLADGTLTLRGITKPVTLTVKFVPHGTSATLDVTAQLKRLDFGIGAGQWADPSMIGDGVTVHGHLVLRAGH